MRIWTRKSALIPTTRLNDSPRPPRAGCAGGGAFRLQLGRLRGGRAAAPPAAGAAQGAPGLKDFFLF